MLVSIAEVGLRGVEPPSVLCEGGGTLGRSYCGIIGGTWRSTKEKQMGCSLVPTARQAEVERLELLRSVIG